MTLVKVTPRYTAVDRWVNLDNVVVMERFDGWTTLRFVWESDNILEIKETPDHLIDLALSRGRM